MSKPTPRWRIILIKATTTPLGYVDVEAADRQSAIREAIEKFGITDRHKQYRLIARRYTEGPRPLAVRNRYLSRAQEEYSGG